MSTEALDAAWRARLALEFARAGNRTLLAKRGADGPLVVQKSLYPEGEEICHAIVVHPPGGIAGGDELSLEVKCEGHALLTTPGAAKWYRSAGPRASQALRFDVEGTLEWLPRETIVFDGARASLDCHVRLGEQARYIGWEIVCLGRTGSNETFSRGELKLDTTVSRGGRLLLVERGGIEAGGRLMRSPVGLGGRTVSGTMLAASASLDASVLARCREDVSPEIAVTLLPGLLVARYLGDSTEQAFAAFTSLWRLLRPVLLGREAIEPRIWRT
ncbi:MAG: urease accessory protein UreD [Betaproteobacteria bacterium]